MGNIPVEILVVSDDDHHWFHVVIDGKSHGFVTVNRDRDEIPDKASSVINFNFDTVKFRSYPMKDFTCR